MMSLNSPEINFSPSVKLLACGAQVRFPTQLDLEMILKESYVKTKRKHIAILHILMSRVLLICGSRSFNCLTQLNVVMKRVLSQTEEPTEVIAGGAPGVDTLAEVWANENGFKFTAYPADWSLGRRAGPIRNSKMIKVADIVVALPAPDSIGTMDTIRKAERAKKELYVFNILTSDDRSYTKGY